MALGNESQLEPLQDAASLRAKALRDQVMALYPLNKGDIPLLGQPVQSGGKKTKGMIINMRKSSFFLACFSLMMLGGVTFLSGFLLGLWFKGSGGNPQFVNNAPPMSPMMQAIPAQNRQGGFSNILREEAQKIGVGRIVGQQASYATQSALNNLQLAKNVPTFLAPLVGALQSAAASEIAIKTQQKVQDSVNNSLAPQQQIQQLPLGGSGQNSAVVPLSMQSQPMTISQQGKDNPSIHLASRQKTTDEKAANKTGVYIIQVGAFATVENAENLVSQLQSNNIMASVRSAKDTQKRETYLVESGRYPNYDMAYQAAQRFSSLGIPGVEIMMQEKANS